MASRPVNLLLPIPIYFGAWRVQHSVVIQTVMTEAILKISARMPQRILDREKKESELSELPNSYIKQFGLLLAPSLLHNSESPLVARSSDIN